MSELRILTSQAIPGMLAAEDVYTRENHLIISKNTMLTDKIITRLKFYTISDLLIFSEQELNSRKIDFIETTYYDRIKRSKGFQHFHQAYQYATRQFEQSLHNWATMDHNGKDGMSPDELLSSVNQLLQHSDNTIGLFNMLHCMRKYDDSTYVHCINVSLICNIIGKWLNFSPEDLEVITLCGLLHDIGKLLIPTHIITKPSKLTNQEYDTIKTHSLRGFELLEDKNIDPKVKYAALMHHERCDGSGYPYGLKSNDIDSFAKLVAIADVYDAMSCARVYRDPICPFDIIHLFETEGYQKYDAKYVMTFLEGIAMTYINNNVRLSDQREGSIIMINKQELSRPVIRLKDEFIDLMKHRNLSIIEIL